MKKFLEKYGAYLVAAVIFVAMACIYCKPQLDGKVLQQGDISSWRGMAHELIEYNSAHPDDPANWTDSMFGGMPAYQIAGNTPSTPLSGILRFFSDIFYKLLHLFTSGQIADLVAYLVCFFILMRAFGIGKWLSIAGSIALTFSSYFLIIIVAGHETKALTLAAMGPVIAGFYLIFRKKYAWGASLVMLFSSYGMMRHPQMAYYMFLMMGVFGIAEIYIHIKEKRVKDLLISLAVFAAAIGVGVGTGYSNMASNSEYVKETMRGGHSELTKVEEGEKASTGLSIDYATQWSYGIDETLTLLIPNYMGGSSSYNLGTGSEVYKDMVRKGISKANARDIVSSLPTYWGDQPFTAGPVYVGAIVCFLFILGLCIVKGPYKWALLASTLLSILLSWGHNMMWFTYLFYNNFPFYDKFRTVSSILVVAEVAMPLLAFLALKAIVDKEVDKQSIIKGIKISAGITGGICLVMALLGGALCSFTSQYDATILQYFPDWLYEDILDARRSMLRSDAWRSLAFIALSAASLWLYVSDKLKLKYFIAATLVLITLDLWPVNRRYFNYDNWQTKTESKETFAKYDYEELLLQDPEHFRVLNTTTDTYNESRTSYYLKSVGGYHAAKLRRYQDLINAHLSRFNMRVINMLNTKYIIVDKDGTPAPTYNSGHMGNAWFVDNVRTVGSPNEESDALYSLDIAKEAVTDASFAQFALTSAPDASASIVLDSYAPHRLKYTSHSNVEKTAVFSEIYYPYGWQAYVDGEPAGHFRVNYVLRALNIPAGDHQVMFEFKPDSIYKGSKVDAAFKLIMYLFVLGCVGYYAVRAARKRKPLIK